jgi:glycerol uptake facilitator-like aquaporin
LLIGFIAQTKEVAHLLGEDVHITEEITKKKQEMRECKAPLARRLFSECLGTFLLVLYITGGMYL